MYKASDDFLRSIIVGSKVAYDCAVTVGGVATKLALTAGSVSLQNGSNTRRTLSATVGAIDTGNLTAKDVYALLSDESAIFTLSVGFDWGSGQKELIPVFTGRASNASLKTGEGTVDFAAADYGYDLAQQSWPVPFVQASSMTRRDAIKQIVTGAGFTYKDTATDTGTLGSEQTWSGSKWDAINQIATDGTMDCFFDATGTFIIRDTPTISQTPVYMYQTGDNGQIKNLDRQRTLDELYNAVKVTPASTDTNNGWTQQYIWQQITDTTSPRHPDKVGLRIKEIQSYTGTQNDGIKTAQTTLDNLQGSTETLNVESIANPALEIGDVIEVLATDRGETVYVKHLVDSYSFDLPSWTMTVSTRSRNA